VRNDPIAVLLGCLGISAESFTRFVSWALAEHLIVALAAHPAIAADGFFNQPDALKRFRRMLCERTKRKWSQHDLQTLFNRVKDHLSKHHRAPVDYGEYLKLLCKFP